MSPHSSKCITFKVADVKSETFGEGYMPVDVSKLATVVDFKIDPYTRESTEPVLTVYKSTNSQVYEVPFKNGFIGTVFDAYCRHHKLTISPDHVWCAIMQAFNIYMNDMCKAEELRKQFVSHEGKITLTAVGGGTLETANWSHLVGDMSSLIEEKTNIGVRQWMEPSFSTTTETDKMVGRLFLMSNLQKFFTYRCCLMCGIPSITLEGIVDDWMDIRHRIEKFPELGLNDWYNKLVPVIDGFVNAAQGKPDIDFWSNICHEEGGGSGPSYLAGWLNVFIPFINMRYVLPKEDGKYGRIDTDDIPAGISTVPFELNDNGNERKLEFCFGFFGCIKKSDDEIRPSLDWVIRDRKKRDSEEEL